ncbi:hypothetical protein GOV10_03185 [Candidatus Woesearchaeota archaeon]|nr:hypothetical protein [Candidatus Woesearchaeota archaeon]
MEKNQVVIVRRDTGEKMVTSRKSVVRKVATLLEVMHNDMFKKAKKEMDSLIVEPKDYAEFQKNIKDKKCNLSLHCGDADCEGTIKEETAASTRVIKEEKIKGKCVKCGKAAKYSVYFSRAY